jgi:hypothetical protein
VCWLSTPAYSETLRFEYRLSGRPSRPWYCRFMSAPYHITMTVAFRHILYGPGISQGR